MPGLRETEEPDGMKAVQFAATELLPSELIALAVGPFDVFQGAPAGHGTPVRVITQKRHAWLMENRLQRPRSTFFPAWRHTPGFHIRLGELDHPDGASRRVRTVRSRTLDLITCISHVCF